MPSSSRPPPDSSKKQTKKVLGFIEGIRRRSGEKRRNEGGLRGFFVKEWILKKGDPAVKPIKEYHGSVKKTGWKFLVVRRLQTLHQLRKKGGRSGCSIFRKKRGVGLWRKNEEKKT